jgi:hypothetical protein
MSVRLVLDNSCLLAYVGSKDPSGLDVAELIFTVRENGDLTAIAAEAVVAVWPDLDEPARSRLVDLASAGDGATVVLPLLADDVVAVAESTVGLPHGDGHAVAEARRYDAPLATFEPAKFGDLLPRGHVLDMTDDGAGPVDLS